MISKSEQLNNSKTAKCMVVKFDELETETTGSKYSGIEYHDGKFKKLVSNSGNYLAVKL